MPPRAVVAGATGIVGRYLITHLKRVGGWQVVGLARRPDQSIDGVDWVEVDLIDRQDCRERVGAIAGATHLFYAARAAPGNVDQENTDNAAMLVNLVDALEPASPDLAHINLVHGTKWYGSHAGRFRTPAREVDPRGPGPYWYFDQHEFVSERQTGKNWTWSSLRPHFVSGVSVRHPHNIMGVVAVYAAVCRELGRPLDFPGNAAGYETLTQLTDAGLLAEVYLALIGGRQPGFGFGADAVADDQTQPVATDAAARPPRRHAPSPAEIEAHTAFIDGLEDPIWRR